MLKNKEWLKFLDYDFSSKEALSLKEFVEKEYNEKTIYPPKTKIFEAFSLTSPEEVKVIILGQDPYHGEGQANGLSFSVNRDQKLPPSLKNIFKELEDDLKIKAPNHGDLSSWAKKGVLLLNTVLTVEKSKAASHRGKGWESFTDNVIKNLSLNKKGLVFILWGSPAQKKKILIDNSKHLILESVHPSPLSSYRGFFGSKPFSMSNNYLKNKAIDWTICS